MLKPIYNLIEQTAFDLLTFKTGGVGKSKYLESPQAILSKLEGKKIMVVDTETTGLFANVHQITEIAAEVVSGPDFQILDSFHGKIKLNEKTLARIKCELEVANKDPKIFSVDKCLQMQNYDPNDTELFEEVKLLTDFYKFSEKHQDAIYVGQNSIFDIRMINTALKRVTPGSEIKHGEVYDTKMFFSIFN
jgi:DNA polymerase III alpha subunit (gram-positive type)